MWPAVRFRFGVAVVAVAMTAACGGGSSGAGSAQPSRSPEASAPASLSVSMTIPDGSILSRAVPWQVTAKGANSDSVSEVRFGVDGRTLWVEHNPPFFFDDDYQLLPPWLLGAGAHTLTAQVRTIDGATSTATAHVTVQVDLTAEKRLAGTYRRVVTPADQRRAESYRVPSKGAFGDETPTGLWLLRITSNGEIAGVNPPDDWASAFIEPYSLNGSTMTLYGAAVWRQSSPKSPSVFCEPERPSDYTVSMSGSSLTITNQQKVCADRDIVFVGTWTRTS